MGYREGYFILQQSTVFSFEWHLDIHKVSVPAAKCQKYLAELLEWDQQNKYNAEQVASLYRKLSHVALVLSIGCAYLIELEKFSADLSHHSPFTPHCPPHRWHNDAAWWKKILDSPISAPIPGPTNLIDVRAYSDASSGFCISLCIHGYWRSY